MRSNPVKERGSLTGQVKKRPFGVAFFYLGGSGAAAAEPLTAKIFVISI